MKRLFFWLALISCFVLRAAELYPAEAPARFPLVYGAMSGNTVPLWIAKEQGFFRKYNLDPQLIFIIAGRAAQAMLPGRSTSESSAPPMSPM
jgi:ABC-type nitrate/sulfonate/bicarbonate transport system substrate-binding protein